MLRTVYARRLDSLLRASPAVALLGPRQCGKTTIAREVGGTYFDLEVESERRRLDLRWDDLVAKPGLVVLDEAQSAPTVFPRIRAAIDGDRKRVGRFLILGSVSPALMREVAESLAGRLALMELTPFLAREVPEEIMSRLWLCGGFPDGGVLDPAQFPRWQRDYLALLAQRDLPNWGLGAPPVVTERLMRMIAAEHGHRWNASKIAKSLGLNHQTVNRYLDYIEGAYLIRRLEPYHGNIAKRLVKTPKIYYRDSGLLHALHGLRDEDDLLGHVVVGGSFEGFVIEQILGALNAIGARPAPYFFATSDGHEIDLLLDFGRTRMAIEVKLTSQPSVDDVRRVRRAASLAGAAQTIIVCRMKQAETYDGVLCAPLLDAIAAACSAAVHE